MQIAELKTAANQIPIVDPGLYAIVAKVMDRKTGNGNYGDWSMQALELKDNTGSIQAVIWNKPDLATLLGKEIHLAAINEGDGWKGCSVEDRAYTAKDGSNKKIRQIKATGKFVLEEAGAAQQPSNGNGTPAPAQYPLETAPVAPVPQGQLAQPQAQPQRVLLTNWTEYRGIVRAAHFLANELEPDTAGPTLQETIDRSRARASVLATILIAWGKKDFVFEAEDDGNPPF